MIKVFIPLVLIITFISCGTGFQKEKENNNSISDANLITESRPVKGFMQTADDTDFYKLQVDIESVCEISLSAIKGVNLAVKIWKGETTPLVVKLIDDTRKSSSEKMANLYMVPGVYFFQITHGIRDQKKKNNETPYILKIKTRSLADEEKDPNDVSNDATQMQVDTEIKGFFSPAYNHNNYSKSGKLVENDWYVLNVKLSDGKSKLLTIKLTEVNGINSIISLYDSSNNLIKEVDVNPAGAGELIKSIGVLKDAVYYIKISNKGYNSNHISPYYLSSQLEPYDPTMEMEPNNSFEKCNDMRDTLIKGQINEPGDSDIFLSNITGNGYVTIKVNPPVNSDIMFTLYSKNKKKLFHISNGRKGIAEIFPNVFLQGPVYVKVKSKNAVEKDNGIYELTIVKNDIADLFDLEPNDSIQKAVLIKSNIIHGYTSYKNDKDYFLVKSESRGTKIVNITAPKN